MEAVVKCIFHYSGVKEMLDLEGLGNVFPGTKTVGEGILEYHKIPRYKDRIKKFGIWAIRFYLIQASYLPVRFTGKRGL